MTDADEVTALPVANPAAEIPFRESSQSDFAGSASGKPDRSYPAARGLGGGHCRGLGLGLSLG